MTIHRAMNKPTATLSVSIPERLHDIHLGTPFTASAGVNGTGSLATNNDNFWDHFDKYYARHKDAIDRAANVPPFNELDDEWVKEGGSKVTVAVETMYIVSEVLGALGHVHPIVNVAVSAIRGILQLDIQRRENNRKVLAVKSQMLSMICGLLPLQDLRRPYSSYDRSDRYNEHSYFAGLIRTIARDIKNCGNFLKYYQDLGTPSKFIKAYEFDKEFAYHLVTLSERRTELQLAIQIYIAKGIDAVQVSISEVSEEIKSMHREVERVAMLLSKLNSPREMECLEFLEIHSVDKCIKRDDLLTTFLAKSFEAETASGKMPSGPPISIKEEVKKYRKTLQRELSEKLEDVLKDNFSRFESLLEVQNSNNFKQFSDKIDTTIRRLTTNEAADQLDDESLREIWLHMGLKRRIVKAKHFVLTLHDYLIAARDQHARAAKAAHSKANGHIAGMSHGMVHVKVVNDDDSWTLKHIHVANVQSIVEALDEDGSGFISIEEANKFALSRPTGWSLLHWIAYWAAGWHLNCSDYQWKIYGTLKKLHKLVSYLPPMNRKLAYKYLDSRPINQIEAILRCLKPLPWNETRDTELMSKATQMSNIQEDGLKTNLQKLSYLVPTPGDVTATIPKSSNRVETWILPLLHLLLEHHLKIFVTAQTEYLNPEEFSLHTASLCSVMTVFWYRMTDLKKIFHQVHRDSDLHFEKFSYGMFSGMDRKIEPIKNTICNFYDIDVSNVNELKPDASVLTKGVGPRIEYRGVDNQIEGLRRLQVVHAIEGSWVGLLHCAKDSGRTVQQDLYTSIYFNITEIVDGKITGQRLDFRLANGAVSGSLGHYDSDAGSTQVEFTGAAAKAPGTICLSGVYDHRRDIIRGRWTTSLDSSYSHGEFKLTRSPPHAFRFRYLLDRDPGLSDHEGLSTSSHAKRRWAFATQATLFKVREDFCSWKFTSERIKERNLWMEVFMRVKAFLDGTVARIPEWVSSARYKLSRTIHQIHLDVYSSMADYFYERSWHDVGLVNCDACKNHILFNWYQCITCVEDDLSNEIDICTDNPECAKTMIFEHRNFVHSPSHTLLRSGQHILPAERKELHRQCNARSEMVKKHFRDMEHQTPLLRVKTSAIPVPQIHGRHGEVTQPLTCTLCMKALKLPCWACAVCDTLLCMDCELSTREDTVSLTWRRSCQPRSSEPPARLSHRLLLISDSTEATKLTLKSSDKKLEDMQESINKMESRVEHTNERMEHVKASLDKVAKAIEVERAMTSPFFQMSYDRGGGSRILQVQNHWEEVENGWVESPVDGLDTPPFTGEIAAANGKMEGTRDGGGGTRGTRVKSLEGKVKKMEKEIYGRMDNIESKLDAILSALAMKGPSTVAGPVN